MFVFCYHLYNVNTVLQEASLSCLCQWDIVAGEFDLNSAPMDSGVYLGIKIKHGRPCNDMWREKEVVEINKAFSYFPSLVHGHALMGATCLTK